MRNKQKRTSSTKPGRTRAGYSQNNTGMELSLRPIRPLNEKQEDVLSSRKHLVLLGSAGTGKTFLASYLAYNDVFRHTYDRLVYIRSAVATRDIGFLPGDDKEKVAVYEAPYMDIATDLLSRGDAYEILKKKGLVHFMSTSFIRGTTMKDAVVIVDECQNMTYHELDSIITRLGENCRIIFCGDIKQADLLKNGFQNFYRVLQRMNEFDFIEFSKEDIVRSDFVKNYIITKDELLDK